ncbi:MAG TPA: DUF362 domain-containing protein [bacterium]|nr:DUF362 domain-containing protein [bacterium]
MERREFIRNGVLTIAGLGVSTFLGRQGSGLLDAAESSPEIFVAKGGSPEELTNRAVIGAGGMGRFVKAGNKVVIKPNIAWNRTPEQGANTHPGVVTALIKMCRKAGASEVIVIDNTCNPWNVTYVTSGIKEAAEKAGAVVRAPLKFRKISIEGASVLKEAEVLEDILDADVFINVPVAKVHGGAKVTIAMKNLMGIVKDRGFFHRNDLHRCIAEINSRVRPHLTVVDATRVLMTRGPQGPGVVNELGIVAAGTDFVAIDAFGTREFLQKNISDIPHIAIASEMKLGISDTSKVKVKNL